MQTGFLLKPHKFWHPNFHYTQFSLNPNHNRSFFPKYSLQDVCKTQKNLRIPFYYSCRSVPFFAFSSFPLSISKQRGLSGRKGRMKTCSSEGTAVKASSIGHKSSVPKSSFKLRVCAVRIPKHNVKISTLKAEKITK